MSSLPNDDENPNKQTVNKTIINENKKFNIDNYVLGQSYINDERFIFGDFFGIVPEKYIKFFNLFAAHLVATIFFGLIYYSLLLDFDNNFFIQGGFPKGQFINHLFLIAMFMSIQFETTTAYVDLKCKNFLSRTVLTVQTVMTFMITFLFLTV
jgi:hypothetical protein